MLSAPQPLADHHELAGFDSGEASHDLIEKAAERLGRRTLDVRAPWDGAR